MYSLWWNVQVLPKFFIIFGGHQSFSWDIWCHCFSLLVTFTLSFKVRLDPFACILCPLHTMDWSDSQFSVIPVNLLPVTMAAKSLTHIPFGTTILVVQIAIALYSFSMFEKGHLQNDGKTMPLMRPHNPHSDLMLKVLFIIQIGSFLISFSNFLEFLINYPVLLSLIDWINYSCNSSLNF